MRVANYELRVGAFCKLRVDSGKGGLVHSKCELRVRKKLQVSTSFSNNTEIFWRALINQGFQDSLNAQQIEIKNLA